MNRCISNRFLGNVVDYLISERIITSSSLAKNTGISVHELSSKDGFIDFQRFKSFVELDESIHRKQLIASPENGIIENPTLDVLFADSPELAAICCNCLSIKNAIQSYLKYKSLKENFVKTILMETEKHLIISIKTDFSSWYTTRMALYEFTTMKAITRFYKKNVNLIEVIKLAHNVSPLEISYLSRVFDCSVELSDENSIYINKKAVIEPFESFNSPLFSFQEKNILNQIYFLYPSDNYSKRVSFIIKSVLNERNFQGGIDESSIQQQVCFKLGVSRWSLTRELNKEGISYSQLYASIRLEIAFNLLKTSKYSILDISSALGFSDQSAFSRFFKEKTGFTPKVYRGNYF